MTAPRSRRSSPPSTRNRTSRSASRASSSPTRSCSWIPSRRTGPSRSRGPFPTRILQREYFGSAAQKNWAMDQVETPWILIVDADERVPRALARRSSTLSRAVPAANAYLHPAREHLRRPHHPALGLVHGPGGAPDPQGDRRVIRTGASTPTSRPRARRRCSTPLAHDTFRSFDQYLEKLHRYAAWGAADLPAMAGEPASSSSCCGRPGASFACTSSRPGSSTAGTGWCSARCRRRACFSSGRGSGSGPVPRGTAGRSSLPAFDESHETWRRSKDVVQLVLKIVVEEANDAERRRPGSRVRGPGPHRRHPELSDYSGKTVVLWFYPKADTPG